MIELTACIYMNRQVVDLFSKFGRILLVSCAVLLPAALFPSAVHADGQPAVSAKSAIVVGLDGGQVLYAKNEHEKLPIASTTKIMTSLLTLEAAEQNNRVVTITPEMVRVEGSSMGLRAGDQLTLRALAEGMLTVSGNDAANSAAIAVGGTLAGFVDRMNQKARSLGLNDTHFVTPSGLDDKNHYSSAADLAALTAAAMGNPDFSAIVSQQKIQISFAQPGMTRVYTNHNRLLAMYSGCTGVKTGFTKKSGRCLVSTAQKDGIRLVCVTLSDPDDWDDHKKLLDYGFSKLVCFKVDDSGCTGSVRVVGGTQESVPVTGAPGQNVVLKTEEAADISRKVELPQFVYAPVQAGQVLGSVDYVSGGKVIAKTQLTACRCVPQEEISEPVFQGLLDWFHWLFWGY